MQLCTRPPPFLILVGALLVPICVRIFEHYSQELAATLFSVVLLFVLALPVAMLARWVQNYKRLLARLRERVNTAAITLFDEQAEVRDGFDRSLTMHPLLAFVQNTVQRPRGQTATGTLGGVHLALGSQLSETFGLESNGARPHGISSYALVDAAGTAERLAIHQRTALAKLFSRNLHPNQTPTESDSQFDEMFSVQGSPAISKAVCTQSVRRQLVSLVHHLRSRNNDFDHTALGFALSKRGLVCWWPDELHPQLTHCIRDLLLEMRENLLRELDRQAQASGALSTPLRTAAHIDPMQHSPTTVTDASKPAATSKAFRMTQASNNPTGHSN